MTILTVGAGKQYATIEAAVAASATGDTIDVSAGTYVNDFVSIFHSLTIEAVGGPVNLVATISPPNGKAIIDEGGAGVAVTLNGLDLSGAVVADGNGAGVRYEGGTLTMNNDTVHGNQDGILANGDPTGSITINQSNFYGNGAGDGYTHNIYVGAIASLVVENSTITAAVVGHDIKSRAASTTIINNTISDGASGSASYEIDLPNGGVGLISGNIIEKGANAQNPTAINFGEEGNLYANSSLTVTGNTILNDMTSHSTLLVGNHTAATAIISNNALFGWGALSLGPGTLTGNTILTTEPALASLAPSAAGSIINYTDVAVGQSGHMGMMAPNAGAPSFLTGQYIWSGSDSVAIASPTPNVFLKGGSGGDALQVTSGQNVLDGGAGSNFLVGGTGADTFFADARGGATVWNTIVNFHGGDAATLWGFVPGASTCSWDPAISGAQGYQGATLRGAIDGTNVTASMTFSGLSVAQAKGLVLTTGTTGGVSYLLLQNPGV
jgi:Ca2+-binding RTX toxin-like protein